MTLGSQAAPARFRIRRRWLLLLGVIVAGVVAAAVWKASRSTATAPPPPPPYICVMPEQQPPVPEPPPPAPPEPVRFPPIEESWDGLARCLAAQPTGKGHPPRVTVEQVRGWVAAGSPVWFADGNWWFPLSDEGDAHMPSGYYVAVPSCGGAIIN